MTSPRVDVVVNRLARRLAHETPVRAAIARVVRDAEGQMALHETRSLAELDQVTRTIAARDTSCVVLAGGDGSYMAGVTALARAYRAHDGGALPVVALAAGGTVSTVARNWGARGTMAQATERTLRAALAAHPRSAPRPTLRVRDTAGGDRVGFIFGAGLVASFFDVYYAAPQQGYAGAARIVARIFGGSLLGGALARRVLTPVPSRLTVDGALQPPEAWSLVLASVVRDSGLHMLVTYRAGEDPARFHAVASPLGARALGPQMPLVLAGRRLLGRHHVDTLARELTLRFTSDAHASYVLDGDVLRAGEVTVTAGPMLRVLSV